MMPDDIEGLGLSPAEREAIGAAERIGLLSADVYDPAIASL